MKKTPLQSGFALAFTLVLMALIAIIVVAYLSSTRIERSTSSVHANRLRAKITADSGMSAAIHLLRENTRYGNYVTAMPPSSPSPAPHYTEIYRPVDPTDPTHVAKANDHLQLTNAAGEVLVSRAAPTPTASPLPQVDPRPTPELVSNPLPAGSPFALSTPNPVLAIGNSYDFNQIVRIGSNSNGYLVDPDGRPAFGQWISVRNSVGEQIARYAFFIEDESMKVNVNVTGNNLAVPSPTASPNLRVNDLAVIPASTPSSQIQEIDPTAVLLSASRRLANTQLVAAGGSGARFATKSTIALLANWTPTDKYAHLLTTLSKDDNTTAKGWQRLDLNALVAGATDNPSKVAIATRIANWIRDAWTGPIALTTLQYHQLFNDNRLRLQIAANIVDYIDSDNTPTDMGDVIPEGGYPEAIPVIGIEKIPYLQAVEILYEASNSTCPTTPVAGTYTANLRLKIQFRFLNLFESGLDLADSVGKIEVKGVPIVQKNNPPAVFDVEAQTFSVNLADLKPVNGSGTCGTSGVCITPAGADGTGGTNDGGAKTFQTDWLVAQPVTFIVDSFDAKPRFLGGKITVKVIGKSGERLDDTAIVTNLNDTGYNWSASSSSSTGDFLTEATPIKGPLQVASINVVCSTSFPTGDPRFRGRIVNDRWRGINRTDATTPLTTNRIAAFIDTSELNPRSYGVDWYDQAGDRPLGVMRNGPMLNIGELGHIAVTEYYWRTLYLQHPERPPNTGQIGPKDEIPLRRSQSLDYVLIDLFRTGGSISRAGALNINTQQQFSQTAAAIATLPLQSLFLGVPVGTPAPTVLTQAAPAAPVPSPADRLSTSVNLLVNFATVAGGSGVGSAPLPYRVASVSNKRNALAGETATPDTNPTRPYFQLGEVASTLSRLLSASEASDTGASTSRSKIVYSALRSDPQSTGITNQNYRRDFQVEQAFREISGSITTRGNVFRVLYVGQAIKNGIVQAEYLGEAFVERQTTFVPEASNPDAIKTSDSTYNILNNRLVTE
jgi:hypothetical protein